MQSLQRVSSWHGPRRLRSRLQEQLTGLESRPMFRQMLFILTVAALVLAGWAVTAQAQNSPKTVVTQVPPEAIRIQPDSTASVMSFDTFVKGAGIMAYPLILLSMVAFFLIVLYTLTIRQGSVVSDAFMNSADALIRKQDYLGLLAVCNRRNECIARITAKTLDFATRNPTASFEEVKEVTEAEGNRQSSLLLSRIAYLGDVGAVAPMLGLLGTTIGMIRTFHEMTGKTYGGSGQLGLAQGVSEALLCTASGLVIGIPSLIFYSIFRGKVNRLISEMEAATTHLMALLAVQYKRAARAVATRQSNDPAA
ncbi:MAG: Biopolymer transporter [Verrucomicrobiaceae bacterium]|nr:Biopolymer transporter [Verrucomicrobiaceae bacterium]